MQKKSTTHKIFFWSVLILTSTTSSFSQFSPGELSRAHQTLEGTENCTRCHDVGKEISGAKCLGCHQEIQEQVTERHGFHFSHSSEACVVCHKDHLGKDAKTMQFDEEKFDHDQSGFHLTGKHSYLMCEKCHADTHIVGQAVKNLLTKYPHRSYLGLLSTCNPCHSDPHNGKFKQECSSCHNTTNWTAVKNFDHSSTKFPLDGKHVDVSCNKCHPGLTNTKKDEHPDMKTQTFTDCTPCHSSPHVSKFDNKTCNSCHTSDGWDQALRKPFDHNMTRYRLVEKHASVRCEQCHRASEKAAFAKVFLLPHQQCIDCHEDKHHGEFKQRYNNNCATCHTERGYKPSTFTLAKHATTNFSLTGGHLAITCYDCHYRTESAGLVFHFNKLACETCHKDVHNGEFASAMNKSGCATCHSTEQWKTTTFDHSATKFPLTGKHTSVLCTDCHKQEGNKKGIVQFRKISVDCESCHKDIHQKQFVVNEKTECSTCHKTEGWHNLTFNHEKQSTFSLRGAHKNVACKDCHHEEKAGDVRFIRFKPLATTCASCHQQRNLK